MSTRAAFGAPELDDVAHAAARARELTGQHFALPDRWFEATSHEVCTLRDLRRTEVLGGGRLAQIRRVLRVAAGGGEGRVLRCETLCPHYRICLQDHNILACVRRRGDLPVLDLLTCVLTHEYVHLVRFQRLDHPYHASSGWTRDEEERVGAIVRGILARSGPSSLRRAAARGELPG